MNIYNFKTKELQYDEGQPPSKVTALFASLFGEAYLTEAISDVTDAIPGTRTSDVRLTRDADEFTASQEGAYCLSYKSDTLTSFSWHKIETVAEDGTYCDIDATYGDTTLAANCDRLIVFTTHEMDSMRSANERLSFSANGITLEISDLQIGAVELKNANTDDRAEVSDADTARTTASHVVSVQHIDAAGSPLSSNVAQETDGNLAAIKTATEKIDNLQGALKSVDTDELISRITDSAGAEINPAKEDGNLATIARDTTAISGKITQLARTNGYEQPAITDDAQIVHDVSVKIPPKAEYTSPNDFTATYTSNVTLTLASLGITITDASQIKYIKQLNALNNVFILVNGINGITFTEAADVITIAGAGTPLAAADMYEVGIDEQRKGYDATNKLWKTQDQSHIWSRYLDADDYTTFTPDDVNYDEGAVINVIGYKTVTLYWTKTASDADDTLIKLIGLTEDGGTSDYQEMSMGSPSGGVTVLTSNVYQLDKASGVNYKVFDVEGLNYCRFDMAKATDTGTDSTLTTLISKEY